MIASYVERFLRPNVYVQVLTVANVDVLYLAPGLSAQADRNFINIRRSFVFSIMTIQDIGDYYYYT